MAKIAIVGTGISGLACAYLLNPEHEITVYEKAPRIGGHSRTLTVDYDGVPIPVDTGFIVFNDKNYPHLTAMFAHLGVPTHDSDMTFSATIGSSALGRGWLEWGARDLNAVLGQRRNLLRPRFWAMARDALTFNAGCEAMVEKHPGLTLGELIAKMGLGDWFRRFYLMPMAGAIWSCPPSEMMRFPARTLVRFFANHCLLSASGQPQWRTVTGGSQAYVARLTAAFAHRIRVGCGAAAVTRDGGKVQITDTGGETLTYDRVVMASHGDEALYLLKDADSTERGLLSAFRYQKNTAVLHRDPSVMPRRKRCWASWVYSSDEGAAPGPEPRIAVTYWMNLLQGIDQRFPLFVSLNPQQAIADHLTFDRAEFDHPVFDNAAIAAQPRLQAIQGQRNTWFAGAHLGHGFHEDGLASAVRVAEAMGAELPWRVRLPGTAVAPQKIRKPSLLGDVPGLPASAELF